MCFQNCKVPPNTEFYLKIPVFIICKIILTKNIRWYSTQISVKTKHARRASVVIKRTAIHFCLFSVAGLMRFALLTVKSTCQTHKTSLN